MNCCLDKAIDLPKKKNPISQFLCENIIMVNTKVFFFFFSENSYCLLKYIFVPSKDWNCNCDFFLQRNTTSNGCINILVSTF